MLMMTCGACIDSWPPNFIIALQLIARCRSTQSDKRRDFLETARLDEFTDVFPADINVAFSKSL